MTHNDNHLTNELGSTIQDAVRQKYATAARQASAAGCCGADGSGAKCGHEDAVTSNLYETSETDGLPAAAVNASLGCGNPTALAEILPGQTVLDLGSGAGLDVLLSARLVGPHGRVFGLDMTDEMQDLARSNAREAGATNVEFLRGQIEAVPLPDESVDVIISNCVVNLSPDKDAVLREAYRVLKPGGLFAVSDVILLGTLSESVRRDMEAWAGCVAGALSEGDYRSRLELAGFSGVEVQVTRTYSAMEALGERCCTSPDSGALASAFIRGRRPKAEAGDDRQR
ncbi:MAG: arsenite methyltransferase [Chloroflexota bacterium]|nr:arsenite methyltransferase [Chloroflexota bacterium]